MQRPGNPERRIFERIDASLKIKYEIVDKTPILKDATSKDISGGGMRISLNEKIDPGAILKLDIEVPGAANKTTTAYGKVVWNRKVDVVGAKMTTYYETGIEFTSVNPLVIGKIFKHFSGDEK